MTRFWVASFIDVVNCGFGKKLSIDMSRCLSNTEPRSQVNWAEVRGEVDDKYKTMKPSVFRHGFLKPWDKAKHKTT